MLKNQEKALKKKKKKNAKKNWFDDES